MNLTGYSDSEDEEQGLSGSDDHAEGSRATKRTKRPFIPEDDGSHRDLQIGIK